MFCGLGRAAGRLRGAQTVGTIDRLDPAFDALVPKDAKIEKIACGFSFVEGPLWRLDGRLWFSDLVANKIRSVTPAGQASVILDQSDGTVSNGRVFFDVTNDPASGVPDGMKIDAKGSVYAAAPGGVWVFSPEGKHLGTIKTPETPSNCNWGDDGKSLYTTAVTSVYRVKLAVAGEKALYR